MTGRIHATAVMVFVIAAAVAGCSGDDAGPRVPSARNTTIPEPSEWNGLRSPSPATTVPDPLSSTASFQQVRTAAAAGQSRVAGERFAIVVAQNLFDIRAGVSGKAIIDTVASPDLDPATRAYLVQDIDVQRRLGLGRRIDVGTDMWIRSEVLGDPRKPERINLELVGMLTSHPGVGSWYGARYDVSWQSHRWWLVAYSDGMPGLNPDKNTSIASEAKLHEGPGWRRIAPGQRDG